MLNICFLLYFPQENIINYSFEFQHFCKYSNEKQTYPRICQHFQSSEARLVYQLQMGISKYRKYKLHLCFNKKTTAEAVVHSLWWGAIRESDPFMSGSQPDVLTVSPIAPRLRYDRCVADYSQGKNSQSANSNF